MHELSICQSLMREVGRVAGEHRSAEVTGIVVAIGPLSGVEPELLRRAFSIARAGTVADGAALEIEEVPLKLWCENCGAETEAAVNALTCATCGTWKVTLRSGNELLLKRVELTVPDGDAAAQPKVAAAAG